MWYKKLKASLIEKAKSEIIYKKTETKSKKQNIFQQFPNAYIVLIHMISSALKI